ncbi:MAG TPA: ice-binding family protein [bacterium]
MKKIIGCLMVMILLPMAYMVGCANNSTGPAASVRATVNLNSAASFAVLASTQITNTGSTTICGDVGLSPGSAMGGGYVLTCGGVLHPTDTAAAAAQGDLTIAYNDAAGRTSPALVAGNLGGKTYYPGLYKSTGSLEISSGDLTLDAQGNSNGVFIFQIASTFNMTPGRQIILAGGAKATNIFWQVGSSCALDTTVVCKGTIMAHNQITLNTGATLEGRALSQIDQVTMLTNTITKPAP